jgi:uncharacterized protein YpmB
MESPKRKKSKINKATVILLLILLAMVGVFAYAFVAM